MRFIAIALVLTSPAAGAVLPVYTTPQPNTEQLTLVSFGPWGDTVGVSHASSIADDPTSYVYQPVDAANFWLTDLGTASALTSKAARRGTETTWRFSCRSMDCPRGMRWVVRSPSP
jgi:hypothetical protein